MRVTRLQIQDFVGLEDFVLDNCGKLNLITGHNGAGKTTILRSLKAALGGGDHASLIRNGKEEAEIVLVFDTGQRLRTVFKHGQRPRREGIEANGAPMKKVQTWIDERLEMTSFNPIAFLMADQKDRLKWLLKVAPLKLTRQELLEAAKPYPAENMLPLDMINEDGVFKYPLDVLSALRAKMYDDRTGVNRIVSDRKATIETLSSTLVSSAPVEDVAAELKTKREQLEQVKSRRQAYAAAIDRAENESLDTLKTEAQKKVDAVKAEAQRRIDKIYEELRTQSDRVHQEAKDARSARQSELSAEEEPLHSEIGRLEEVSSRASKDAYTRRQIESFQIDFAAHEKQSLELTGAIEQLDVLRGQLLEQLPLKGLEVREGKLLYRGVDYDSLNEASQVMVACRLAEVAAADLGIVCVEGIHKMLDTKRREAFMKWALKSDLQFWVTEVTDGPLEVQVEN